MTGSLVDERRQLTVLCPWEDLGCIQCIEVIPLNTGRRRLNVLKNLSASCNSCVLLFSIFLRLTEMYRGFLLFSLSAVDIPWARASRHQCCICSFGQMRYPSYWDLGWIMELTGNQIRKKKKEEEEWGCIIRHFILKVCISFWQSKILAQLRN